MTTPPDRRLSSHWQQKAAEVDAANGEYVKVGEGVSANVAYRINSGRLAAFRPAGAYHAKTVASPDKGRYTVDVWAARVG